MKDRIKEIIKKLPVLGDFFIRINRYLRIINPGLKYFKGSRSYWEGRYFTGGNSGVGSYGKFAEFKSSIINNFVESHNINSVIEFGCGDGNQITHAKYPDYSGFDVSEIAISKCKQIFAKDLNKHFALMKDYDGKKAELALSLDVIYHLIEDDIFENYMRTLFESSEKYVIIYSSDSDDNRGYEGTHVRHRKFTSWIEQNLKQWKLMEYIPNKYPYRGDYLQGSFADFYIFIRE